jgi:hypothetical protein
VAVLSRSTPPQGSPGADPLEGLWSCALSVAAADVAEAVGESAVVSVEGVATEGDGDDLVDFGGAGVGGLECLVDGQAA